MLYSSTRGSSKKVSGARAIVGGLAPDGGLFVPETIPKLTAGDFDAIRSMSYSERAAFVCSMYLDGFTQDELRSFTASAYGGFRHPLVAPVAPLDGLTSVLELWHGPTCAFKDMALALLPYLLTASLKKTGETRKAAILVATSGDTGKAALEGFRDVPGTRIAVFYPSGGVSEVQRLQMVTQEGANVLVCGINGNFDDAQTTVKAVFSDRAFNEALSRQGFLLSSANSINWGRLLPQIAYYVSAYVDCVGSGCISHGERLNVCVPTGNFGNILAAWYAKKMGVPFGKLICASNENNVLTQFLETGVYDRNRDFFRTISPSMDILISSNLERLLYGVTGDCAYVAGLMRELADSGRYSVSGEAASVIGRDFAAGWCSGDDAKHALERVFKTSGYLMDTHTSVGMRVLDGYRERSGDLSPALLVSTASPFKFCESVLDALGETVPDGADACVSKLARVAGIAAPAPLTGLSEKEIRFDKVLEKSGVKPEITGFLSKDAG